MKQNLLRDWLPYEALGCEYENDAFVKHLDVPIVKEVKGSFDGSDEDWIGTHKNVLNWCELENGICVGWNENPARGWSFPIKKKNKKNNFDNLRKLLPECLVMYERLEAWRKSDISASESVKVFEEYIKDNNELVEKVVKAFYEDTKEYNSWQTLESTMLRKDDCGEWSEYRLKYPLDFINETLNERVKA